MPNVFKPKTENKNALYITPYLSVTLCIKTKNRKKKTAQDYMIGTGKNVEAVYKLKKNQQSKSKFFTFLFEGIYSVCQFLYFYILFAFTHYTFCFNRY